MRAETKAAKIAAMFGLEVPKPPSKKEQWRREAVSREAEAVILFHEDRDKFLQRECRICKRQFAVNRAHIAFCSDDCRSVHLNDVVGLEWDPNGRSPAERWASQTGGSEPLIVPPPALEILLARPEPEPDALDDDFDLSLPDVDALLGE